MRHRVDRVVMALSIRCPRPARMILVPQRNRAEIRKDLQNLARATLVITNTGQEQALAACDAATIILMKSPEFK